jgi:hypothetical protein
MLSFRCGANGYIGPFLIVRLQRLLDFGELGETETLDDLSLNRLDQTINGIGSVGFSYDNTGGT